MRKALFFTTMMLILFSCIRLSLIFFSPSFPDSTQIDPNQIGFAGLFKNPIIQLLFCFSLIIMLFGISYVDSMVQSLDSAPVRPPTISLILIFGLLSYALIILIVHWAYIDSKFVELASMLLYESYNPKSEPGMTYYQWRYSINPAKAVVSLVLFPILLAVFYLLVKIRQRQ